MPRFLAASTTRVPSGTVTGRPSMVSVTIFTSGMDEGPFDRAGLVEAVLLVLATELGHGRLDHPAGGVAQAAQAPPALQALLHPVEQVHLDLAALPGEDALEGPHRPVGADAARRALAARLVGVEAHQPAGRL